MVKSQESEDVQCCGSWAFWRPARYAAFSGALMANEGKGSVQGNLAHTGMGTALWDDHSGCLARQRFWVTLPFLGNNRNDCCTRGCSLMLPNLHLIASHKKPSVYTHMPSLKKCYWIKMVPFKQLFRDHIRAYWGPSQNVQIKMVGNLGLKWSHLPLVPTSGCFNFHYLDRRPQSWSVRPGTNFPGGDEGQASDMLPPFWLILLSNRMSEVKVPFSFRWRKWGPERKCTSPGFTVRKTLSPGFFFYPA